MSNLDSFFTVIMISILMLISCDYDKNNDDFSLYNSLPVGSSNITKNEVKIGEQRWMVKNLDVVTFRNGDSLLHAKNYEEWRNALDNEQPAWCFYEDDSTNGNIYGKLYNWYAVNDLRGLAPDGWKIPSEEDWLQLADYLGGFSIAGNKMKFTDHWIFIKSSSSGNSQTYNPNGSNESGFSGLPGGYRDWGGWDFSIGYIGVWWSKAESDTLDSWGVLLDSRDNFLGILKPGSGSNRWGFSVRCIRE